jgi:hypothetical protein
VLGQPIPSIACLTSRRQGRTLRWLEHPIVSPPLESSSDLWASLLRVIHSPYSLPFAGFLLAWIRFGAQHQASDEALVPTRKNANTTGRSAPPLRRLSVSTASTPVCLRGALRTFHVPAQRHCAAHFRYATPRACFRLHIFCSTACKIHDRFPTEPSSLPSATLRFPNHPPESGSDKTQPNRLRTHPNGGNRTDKIPPKSGMARFCSSVSICH